MKALLMNGPSNGRELTVADGTSVLILPYYDQVATIRSGGPLGNHIKQIEYRRVFDLPNGVAVFDCA